MENFLELKQKAKLFNEFKQDFNRIIYGKDFITFHEISKLNTYHINMLYDAICKIDILNVEQIVIGKIKLFIEKFTQHQLNDYLNYIKNASTNVEQEFSKLKETHDEYIKSFNPLQDFDKDKQIFYKNMLKDLENLKDKQNICKSLSDYINTYIDVTINIDIDTSNMEYIWFKFEELSLLNYNNFIKEIKLIRSECTEEIKTTKFENQTVYLFFDNKEITKTTFEKHYYMLESLYHKFLQRKSNNSHIYEPKFGLKENE